MNPARGRGRRPAAVFTEAAGWTPPNAIRALRLRQKLTQQELAQKAGIKNSSAIGRAERKGIGLSLKSFLAVARALGVTAEELADPTLPKWDPLFQEPTSNAQGNEETHDDTDATNG